MKKSILVSSLATLIVTASGVVAHAGDVCLNLGGVYYIGKSVKLPSKGKCSTWKGIAPGLCLGVTGISTGTICTATDDSDTYGQIITTCFSGGVYTDHFSLPRPDLTGGTERYSTVDTGSGGSNQSFSANIADCEVALGDKAPPIP